MPCKKTLTMAAVVAATVMTLSACGSADPGSDAGADATRISDEQLAAPDEIDPDQIDDTAGNAVEVDIPLHMIHLHGEVEPDYVTILCAGDYAFLHTWTSGFARNYGVRVSDEANATTVRFAEHDSLCAQAQSSTELDPSH